MYPLADSLFLVCWPLARCLWCVSNTVKPFRRVFVESSNAGTCRATGSFSASPQREMFYRACHTMCCPDFFRFSRGKQREEVGCKKGIRKNRSIWGWFVRKQAGQTGQAAWQSRQRKARATVHDRGTSYYRCSNVSHLESFLPHARNDEKKGQDERPLYHGLGMVRTILQITNEIPTIQWLVSSSVTMVEEPRQSDKIFPKSAMYVFRGESQCQWKSSKLR